MGQLGFQELIVIFIIALLIFGPKKLPELGKSLGKGLKEFRRATDDLKSQWSDQMRDIETSTKDVTSEIKNAKDEFYKTQGTPPESKPEDTAEPATQTKT